MLFEPGKVLISIEGKKLFEVSAVFGTRFLEEIIICMYATVSHVKVQSKSPTWKSGVSLLYWQPPNGGTGIQDGGLEPAAGRLMASGMIYPRAIEMVMARREERRVYWCG